MKTINLNSIVWKEGKYYVAQCINVDVSSFGTSKQDAIKNLDEALELYFEDVKTQEITKVEHPEIINNSLKYG